MYWYYITILNNFSDADTIDRPIEYIQEITIPLVYRDICIHNFFF